MAEETKQILIVEDEPNIAEPLSFLLEREGYAITVKPDGRQGLDAAMKDLPDLVLLDVMLPVIDGFEVLRRLRQTPHGANVPVVILTARGQRGDRQAALDSGADMFIPKPFANAEVISAVKELLGDT